MTLKPLVLLSFLFTPQVQALSIPEGLIDGDIMLYCKSKNDLIVTILYNSEYLSKDQTVKNISSKFLEFPEELSYFMDFINLVYSNRYPKNEILNLFNVVHKSCFQDTKTSALNQKNNNTSISDFNSGTKFLGN